ncbi:MAG: class 1 fructose-bisphosphatase [Deltaproteobacteria bacterium]|nr:class 1 fructose-bisphosphatase [Deltaproteobacteria bacterium]MBW2139615.1 class 1 fructose-bisphosphatase [Deltaproteobacteria bacterium]
MLGRTTVTQHLLLTQTEVSGATGTFTRLINELIVAAKLISREVNKAGLNDIIGYAGRENVQGEAVRKLDDFSNDAIIRRLQSSGVLCAMASEEVADVIEIPRNYPVGDYLLIFDPLDGSSNIDVNVSVGTIFSVLHRTTDSCDQGTLEDILQPGYKQVAAGYFVYGSSTIMVFCAGNGVHGFTLDPSIGEFLLSHENMKIPERGNTFSINEGNYYYWSEDMRRYIDYLKDPKADHRGYTSRYVGSLVADFHRNLIHGGIFLYPADTKDPRKPHGKLRLMCEANPLAYIVEHAGGSASDGTQRIMNIIPEELHQRVPLIIGSKEEVRIVEEFIQGKR